MPVSKTKKKKRNACGFPYWQTRNTYCIEATENVNKEVNDGRVLTLAYSSRLCMLLPHYALKGALPSSILGRVIHLDFLTPKY